MASPFDFVQGFGENPFSLIPPQRPPMSIPGITPVPPPMEPSVQPPPVPVQPPQPEPQPFNLQQGQTFAPPSIDFNLGGGGPGQQQQAYRRAMQLIESGDYNNVTPTGRGFNVVGAYQVSEQNIPEWTQRWFGQRLTPEEFRRNPAAQDAVFDGQFGEYIRQYGSPERAAQAWIGGPGGVASPTGSADRFGTTPLAHGRNFMSALSRIGVQPGMAAPQNALAGQQFPGQLAQATGMEPGAPFPGALLPTPPPQQPAPVSSQAAAMVPGLAQFDQVQQPQQRQPDLFGQFVDFLQGGAATRPAIAQGYLDYIRGSPTGAELSVQQQQSTAAIYSRGQQLQAENPNASPQQLAQLLIRDPVWGRNALSLGTKAPAVLQAAVTPLTPPQVTLSLGQQVFQQGAGGQFQPTAAAVPPQQPDLVRISQYLQSLPPEQQQAELQRLTQIRQAQSLPSDREQANARIQQSIAAGQEPSIFDLQLGGWIRQEPVTNEFGAITGYRAVNTYPQFARPTFPGAGQPAPTAPGAGAPGAPVVPPPAAGAPGPTQVPTGGPTQVPGAPRALNTQPRVVGRMSDTGREILDAPDLSLSTSIIGNPAHMVLGAGPISAFRGAWGTVIGNLPQMAATEEETLSRQSLLQGFIASLAQYQEGVKLAGEHTAVMAVAPKPGEILTNPLRATNQFIAIREGLITDLRLATQNAADQGLDASTRKKASDRIANIRGLLARMPTLEGLYELSNQLRTGAEVSGTEIPNLGKMIGGVQEGAGRAGERLLGSSQSSQLPGDLSGYSVQDLQKLSHRPNLSRQDAKRLLDALKARVMPGAQ